MKALGVELRPLPGCDSNLCQGLSGPILTELVHVAGAGCGIAVGCDDEAVGVLVLRPGHVGVVSRIGPSTSARLSVDYDGHVHEARVYGGQGVLHVDDEGGASHVGPVRVLGSEAHVLGHRVGRWAGNEQAVDIRE